MQMLFRGHKIKRLMFCLSLRARRVEGQEEKLLLLEVACRHVYGMREGRGSRLVVDMRIGTGKRRKILIA